MSSGNGNGNGKHPPSRKKLSRTLRLPEDDFSRELKTQGDDGKLLALLYQRNPMAVYIKRVSDESIRY